MNPGAPAHQIAYQQCPDCRRATQNGAGREINVAPEVFERASCDAKVIGSLDATTPERATTTVTPRLREQVFARDHHRCTVPGCRSARNLDIHHIFEQAKGGRHELWNLTLLCSGHHAALHAGLLSMRGQAPYHIEFQWTYAPPIPIGLDPDARKAMIEQRVHQILERTFPEGNSALPDHSRITGRPAGDGVLVGGRGTPLVSGKAAPMGEAASQMGRGRGRGAEGPAGVVQRGAPGDRVPTGTSNEPRCRQPADVVQRGSDG